MYSSNTQITPVKPFHQQSVILLSNTEFYFAFQVRRHHPWLRKTRVSLILIFPLLVELLFRFLRHSPKILVGRITI